jgi:hypothetical protein
MAIGVFCFLAILGLIALIYAVGSLNGKQGEQRYAPPHAHAQNSKDDIERACLRANPADVIECVTERVEASEETARTEQDLTAQQRAAWAALIGAGFSLLSLLVSGLGLWALLETIKQGRTALKATREAIDAEKYGQRAWMCYENFSVDFVEGNDQSAVGLRFLTRWQNCGQTPALNVRIYTELRFVPRDDPIPRFEAPHAVESAMNVGPGKLSNGRARFLDGRAVEAARQRLVMIYLYNHVLYQDIFNPQITRVSEACYQFDMEGQVRDQDGSVRDFWYIQPVGDQKEYT